MKSAPVGADVQEVLGAEAGLRRCRAPRGLPSHQPQDCETEHRAEKPDKAQCLVRGLRHRHGGTPSSLREGREHESLDDEHKSKGCEKVGHRTSWRGAVPLPAHAGKGTRRPSHIGCSEEMAVVPRIRGTADQNPSRACRKGTEPDYGAGGFGASLGISLPAGLPKYLKKSESGLSTSRVSPDRSPAS